MIQIFFIYKPEITDNLSGVEETVLRFIGKNGGEIIITEKVVTYSTNKLTISRRLELFRLHLSFYI